VSTSYTSASEATSFSIPASTVTITSSAATNCPRVICRSITSALPRTSSAPVTIVLKPIAAIACTTSTRKWRCR
jgi:hypothetical protein